MYSHSIRRRQAICLPYLPNLPYLHVIILRYDYGHPPPRCDPTLPSHHHHWHLPLTLPGEPAAVERLVDRPSGNLECPLSVPSHCNIPWTTTALFYFRSRGWRGAQSPSPCRVCATWPLSFYMMKTARECETRLPPPVVFHPRTKE